MPETASYGFEYETPQSKPGITLTGDIDGSAPILAEQVDTVISGIDSRLTSVEGSVATLEAAAVNDSGWLNLSVTPAVGYTVVSSIYRRWGPIASIYIQLERTGAAFAANSAGGVADTNICTIADVNLRPSQLTHAMVRITLTSGAVDVGTNGIVTIVDMHANSVINTNDNVRLAHTYFTATTF